MEYGEQPELVPESKLNNCQYSFKYYYRDTDVEVDKEYPDVGKYYLSIYNSGSDLYKPGWALKIYYYYPKNSNFIMGTRWYKYI